MNLPKPIKFEVERYVGGLSKFKKIENPIKLSANESALGPSPKAIEAFENEKNKIFNNFSTIKFKRLFDNYFFYFFGFVIHIK